MDLKELNLLADRVKDAVGFDCDQETTQEALRAFSEIYLQAKQGLK